MDSEPEDATRARQRVRAWIVRAAHAIGVDAASIEPLPPDRVDEVRDATGYPTLPAAFDEFLRTGVMDDARFAHIWTVPMAVEGVIALGRWARGAGQHETGGPWDGKLLFEEYEGGLGWLEAAGVDPPVHQMSEHGETELVSATFTGYLNRILDLTLSNEANDWLRDWCERAQASVGLTPDRHRFFGSNSVIDALRTLVNRDELPAPMEMFLVTACGPRSPLLPLFLPDRLGPELMVELATELFAPPTMKGSVPFGRTATGAVLWMSGAGVNGAVVEIHDGATREVAPSFTAYLDAALARHRRRVSN